MSDGRPLAQAGGQHNIPSFVVRLDCADSSLKSPFGGGRPGRVKRENLLKGQPGGVANDDEED